MTNIVYLVPTGAFVSVENPEVSDTEAVSGVSGDGVIPVSVYLIYNGIAMKNPVYPYYNSLFHSPYFGETDFKDRDGDPAI